jgi:hypothetical protein
MHVVRVSRTRLRVRRHPSGEQKEEHEDRTGKAHNRGKGHIDSQTQLNDERSHGATGGRILRHGYPARRRTFSRSKRSAKNTLRSDW